jgi:hypothetical protein
MSVLSDKIEILMRATGMEHNALIVFMKAISEVLCMVAALCSVSCD